MTSTISRQEKAGATCSADTCCETSRIRRRYARQRWRAAAASKLLRRFGEPALSGRTGISGAQHVIGRPVPQLVKIGPPPAHHLGKSFLPPDRGFPAHTPLMGRGAEP